MENIQRNKTAFQNAKEFKTKIVELPVTIRSEYSEEVGNELGEARQQIEIAVFSVQALFNTIKTTSFFYESDAAIGTVLNTYIGDLLSLARLGYGLGNSILSALAVFEDVENNIREGSALNSPEKIAEQISALLNNPNVPKPLAQGFSVAMTDFINSQLEHDEFNDDMSSPEYIARHLKIYGGEKNV